MKHNESMADREVETPESEPVKPSKLNRIKSTAVSVGIATIPVVVMVGGTFAGYRTGKMQFDAAKLNLEAAKLTLSAAQQKS